MLQERIGRSYKQRNEFKLRNDYTQVYEYIDEDGVDQSLTNHFTGLYHALHHVKDKDKAFDRWTNTTVLTDIPVSKLLMTISLKMSLVGRYLALLEELEFTLVKDKGYSVVLINVYFDDGVQWKSSDLTLLSCLGPLDAQDEFKQNGALLEKKSPFNRALVAYLVPKEDRELWLAKWFSRFLEAYPFTQLHQVRGVLMEWLNLSHRTVENYCNSQSCTIDERKLMTDYYTALVGKRSNKGKWVGTKIVTYPGYSGKEAEKRQKRERK